LIREGVRIRIFHDVVGLMSKGHNPWLTFVFKEKHLIITCTNQTLTLRFYLIIKRIR